jgi:hypothetical protein
MRNLKKVLSLALVLVMACGFMLSAGAIDASTASDWDKITNKDSVALLSALDIMGGFPDGTFRGEESLNRAQVTKMIYVARTGGIDDGAAMFTDLSLFNDLGAAEWAKGYINYAATIGIVAGYGDGVFKPLDSITGYELLKICLTALGYNAEVEGFVGLNWKANVAAIAKESGLTVGYTANPNNPISRDDAALIIANMIYLNTVVYKDDAKDFLTTPTFGKKYLNLDEIEGVLISNGTIAISGQTYQAGVSVIWVPATTTTAAYPASFTYSLDAKYLGYTMTALVRMGAKGITGVYGITPKTGANAIISGGNYSNLGGGSGLANAAKSTLGVDIAEYYVNYVAYTAPTLPTPGEFTYAIAGTKEDEVRFVDNNNDGKFEYAFKIDYSFANVSSVTASSVRIGSTSVAKTDIEGTVPAANDRVAYYTYPQGATTKYVVTVLDSVVATPTKAQLGDSPYVVIDGVNYSQPNTAIGTTSAANVNLGKEGTFWLYKSFLVDYSGTVAPTNYAYVVNSYYSAGLSNTYQVSVVLSGDAEKTGAQTMSLGNGSVGYGLNLNDDTVLTPTVVDAGSIQEAVNGTIFTYTINGYGQLVLTNPTSAMTTPNTVAGSYTSGDAVLTLSSGAYTVDSTSIVFVQGSASSGGAWTYYTGINKIPSITFPGANTVGLVTKAVAGVANKGIGAVAISNTAGSVASTGDAKFYVVLSSVITQSTATGTEYLFNVFDGTNTIENQVSTTDKDSTAKDIAKFGVYTFEFAGGKVAKATPVAKNVEGIDSFAGNDTLGFVTYNTAGSVAIANNYRTAPTATPNPTPATGFAPFVYKYNDSTKENAVSLYALDSKVVVYFVDTSASKATAGTVDGLSTVALGEIAANNPNTAFVSNATNDSGANAGKATVNYDTLLVISAGKIVAIIQFSGNQSIVGTP